MTSLFVEAADALELASPLRISGRVGAVRGMTLTAPGVALPIGALVRVESGRAGGESVLGEVVGFDDGNAIVMLLGNADGLRAGARVESVRSTPTVPAGDALLGRCVDALGRPIDGRGPIRRATTRAIDASPIGAMRRRPVDTTLHTGVRAIDLMATMGEGQRLGVFAGPGVGKSTLIGQIARNGRAEVNVIALIGERGREVREFIDHSLGPEGLERSVLVVSTSDESPVMRARAARAACTIAEEFRDRGKNVMLVMDSVTRFAHALRQIGLAVGEPPATKGYTPSVFAGLASLLERAGGMLDSDRGAGGSITGLYTVLVEGDDMTEPVADAARGILDGHIILSRALAQRGHFPAIDVLDSVSRAADQVSSPELIAARRRVRALLAAYAEIEELVQVGAYVPGGDPVADVARQHRAEVLAILQQGVSENEGPEEALARFIELSDQTVRTETSLRSGEAGG